MPITKLQLGQALSEWCEATMFHGWPPDAGPPMVVINHFINSDLMPQEENVWPACAEWVEHNVQVVDQVLQARLQAIGFHTDVTPENIGVTKAHNFQECAAWIGMSGGNLMMQIHELLTDLANWQPGWRGSQIIVRTFKLIRAFSR